MGVEARKRMIDGARNVARRIRAVRGRRQARRIWTSELRRVRHAGSSPGSAPEQLEKKSEKINVGSSVGLLRGLGFRLGELVEGAERIETRVHHTGAGAHVDRHAHCLQHLLARGAPLERCFGVERDAVVAARRDGNRQRDQFLRLASSAPAPAQPAPARRTLSSRRLRRRAGGAVRPEILGQPWPVIRSHCQSPFK